MINEKISGVYYIENTRTKKLYIGSSKNINSRITTHFRDLKHNRHTNRIMQDDYNKGDDFSYGVLKTIPGDHEILYTEESEQIQKAKDDGRDLYNIFVMSDDYFKNSDDVQRAIIDKFCMDNYGKTYAQKTANYVPAEYSLLYETILHPEQAAELKEKYSETIQYQKRRSFMLCRNNIIS